MTISANTLGETAVTLMSQLNAGTITFENYRNSMNSVIESTNNNSEFQNEDNEEAIHNVNIAFRLTKGEQSNPRKK
jgi:hypothetical protein